MKKKSKAETKEGHGDAGTHVYTHPSSLFLHSFSEGVWFDLVGRETTSGQTWTFWQQSTPHYLHLPLSYYTITS